MAGARQATLLAILRSDLAELVAERDVLLSEMTTEQADLARRLTLPVEIDFLEVSSYGNDTSSSRQVRILNDLRDPIAGRDVLIVEDIIDSGLTLAAVVELLAARGPARLQICALLDKAARREVPVEARFVGFEIPDEFVVGYGIDYAQRNRNLPYVGRVVFD